MSCNFRFLVSRQQNNQSLYFNSTYLSRRRSLSCLSCLTSSAEEWNKALWKLSPESPKGVWSLRVPWRASTSSFKRVPFLWIMSSRFHSSSSVSSVSLVPGTNEKHFIIRDHQLTINSHDVWSKYVKIERFEWGNRKQILKNKEERGFQFFRCLLKVAGFKKGEYVMYWRLTNGVPKLLC